MLWLQCHTLIKWETESNSNTVESLYQGSFDHVKVSVKPFFDTKLLISFVFDIIAILLGFFLKDYANTLSWRPVGGL